MATLTATIAYGQPVGTMASTIGTPGPQGIPGPTGPAGPAPIWGNITGTLSNQTDLWSILGSKLATASNLSELTATASTARTNLGLGSMAVASASNYSTTSVANGLYYPLSGNPSGFLTTATAATTYLPLSGGALTGPITMSGETIDSEISSDFFGIELSGDLAQYSELEYNQLTVANSGGFTKVTPAGITFQDLSIQTTAGIPDATSDGTPYARKDGAWEQLIIT